MFTYNNELILDMSHLFSAQTLVELDREIVVGLACSKNIFHSVGKELSRGDAELGLYDHSYKDVGLAEHELEAWETESMQSMTFAERQRYLRFAKGAYHPWAVCLALTTNSSWSHKMSPKDKVVTDEARSMFKRTIDVIYSLPIFESIGRICIFGVDPSQHVTCHRDENPEKWPVNDELLMVSPRGNKKFYVYDPEKKQRHYISSDVRSYIFHDLNFHGVDPLPYFTYTIRIDGLYTDEFRSSLHCSRKAMSPKDVRLAEMVKR